jgi:hypothetical protein
MRWINGSQSKMQSLQEGHHCLCAHQRVLPWSDVPQSQVQALDAMRKELGHCDDSCLHIMLRMDANNKTARLEAKDDTVDSLHMTHSFNGLRVSCPFDIEVVKRHRVKGCDPPRLRRKMTQGPLQLRF